MTRTLDCGDRGLMNEILFHYEKIDPTTWVYLSSLLIIGLFFKFGRFWSVRNLDLVLLVLLAPGLLLVSHGQEQQRRELAAITKAQDFLEPPTEDPAAAAAPAPDDGSAEPADEPANETLLVAPTEPQKSFVPTETPAEIVAPPESTAAANAALESAQEQLVRGQTIERIGFLWLLMTGLLLLVRLLIDPTMVRRPLLEPNITTGGLTFSCCSLFVFLMANVAASRPTADDLRGPLSAERLLSRRSADDLKMHGPGYALIFTLPSLPTVKVGTNLARQRVEDPAERTRHWTYYSEEGQPLVNVDAEYLGMTRDDVVRLRKLDGRELAIDWSDLSSQDQEFVEKIQAYTTVAKLMAILSHLAIVLGIIAIGYWHFHNVKMGIGAATLYLMLPYTSQMTGRVDHVLPAALLVGAILWYRQPLTSGIFVGLAIGVIYYPLFLLPLWFSFYWQRGLMRFSIGIVSMLVLMVLMLAFVSQDAASFWQSFKEMFGLMPPQMDGLSGLWGLDWAPVYRYPVLAAFVALSGSFAIWPAQKNLGTLLSCSAAIMVATQFWHGYGGGLYMAWYLPLLLLTVFRPNLEDRVAISTLDEGWLPRRKRFGSTHSGLAA
jgi:hypothetical protein